MPNFTPPRILPLELVRHAALDALNKVRDVPLVVVIAPSGYGKTILLAQDARRSPHPTAWLTLDAEAADAGKFIKCVVLALQATLPEMSFALETPNINLQAVHVAEVLNAADRNISLVLDNADILSEDGGRWLTLLVEHLREGHQVLATSYGLLNMPLARLSAAGLCAIITEEHLKFGVTETQELIGVDESAALELVTKLNGWPMAIALNRNGSGQVLGVDSLIRESISRLSAPLQAALPALGALDQWDEILIRAANLSLPSDWLDEMRRSGLPITFTTDEVALPHRELLRWLQRRLASDPTYAQDIYRQVAGAYQRAGQNVQAMHAFLRADDQIAAEKAIRDWVQHSWQQGELRSILSVLDQLQSLHMPILRASYGYALVQAGRFAEASELLASLPDELGFQRESSRMTMSISQGQYDQALAELGHAAEFQTSRAEADYLALMRAVLMMATGDRAQAHALAVQLQRDFPPGAPEHVERTANVLYTMDLHDYQDYVRLASGLMTLVQTRPGHVEELIQTWSLPAITTAFLLQDQPEHSPLFQQPTLPDRQATEAAYRDAWQGRAELLAATGDFGAAGQAYERALHYSVSRQSALEIIESLAGLAEVAFACRDSEQARAWLYQMQPSGHPEAVVLTAYLDGLNALVNGQKAEAVAAFTRAANTDVFSLTRWKALLLARGLGQTAPFTCPEPPTLSWLEKFTSLIIAQYTAGWDTGDTESPAAVTDRHMVDSAAEQSTRLNGSGSARWTLEVITCGRLSAQVNGQLVAFPFVKAAELFAYLLTNGPTDREQLIDALWDGSGDPKHADYFRVSVRRLRLALGEVSPGLANPVPLIAGQYRLAPEYVLQVDIDAIRRACADGTAENLRAAWGVTGLFMPKAETAWVVEQRDQLREGLVRATIKHAAEVVESDVAAAITAYEQLLRLDPASEQGYEGLIHAQVLAGQHLLAAHSYEQYVRMMDREYGVGPAPHVKQLLPMK